MLTFINVKFIFNCLFIGRLGDKGLFSAANILQIADVFHRVVFLVFLLCFRPIVHLLLPRETCKMVHQFVLTTKTTQFLG